MNAMKAEGFVSTFVSPVPEAALLQKALGQYMLDM